MYYTAADDQTYHLNLIDTPGHVDFGYEVSRALAACEGAVLVVDASQGIEAQTLANLYMALEADLEIVPVINKIDLPAADPQELTSEISALLGVGVDEIIQISAKEGMNIEAVFEAIVDRIPAPEGDPQEPLKALIFDSHYDLYKGVVAYVRVMQGRIEPTDDLELMATGTKIKPVEIGIFSPNLTPSDGLGAGEVGYIATGLKTLMECRVGDTVTYAQKPADEPLPGYRKAKPMVFAGIFPVEAEDFEALKNALEKLQLNDASLSFQQENSQALNFGFRCGFLGMFHMEIIQERIEREYDLDIITTAPSVEYEVILKNGESIRIDSPAQMPDQGTIEEIREPWMEILVFTPTDYYGMVMDLVTKRRGVFVEQEYPSASRVQLSFQIPLSELIVDFFDQLKSRTRGYASLDYQFSGYQAGNLRKLEILVNKEPVDALATIVHQDQAERRGRALVAKLKELIPRQLFALPIQAAVGGRIVARTDVKALRKDVIAKCYGGDVTRKRKLLERQKRGKKRMKTIANVDIPQEAFMAVLRLEED
jgi:GTP-binding protein LepA